MARPKNKAVTERGFFDPSGEYPRTSHINESSLNKAARGHNINKV